MRICGARLHPLLSDGLYLAARWVSYTIVGFTFALAQQQSPKGRLEGLVVDSGGVPVTKATVILYLTNATQALPVANSMLSPLSTTASDKDGKFVFDGLEAGRYELSAQKVGFLRYSLGAGANTKRGIVNLAAGQTVKDVSITMTRPGAISGRVVDEDGDLYPDVSIAVFRKENARSGMKIQEVAGIQGRLSGGEFQYSGFAPGNYFIAVFPKYNVPGAPAVLTQTDYTCRHSIPVQPISSERRRSI